jgi:hypothetical protein
MFTLRLPPPRLAGGIRGLTNPHSKSVRSLDNATRYDDNGRDFRSSTFGDPQKNQIALLNHNRFVRLNFSSDRHSGLQPISKRPFNFQNLEAPHNHQASLRIETI